jgi:hypothetical protein
VIADQTFKHSQYFDTGDTSPLGSAEQNRSILRFGIVISEKVMGRVRISGHEALFVILATGDETFCVSGQSIHLLRPRANRVGLRSQGNSK